MTKKKLSATINVEELRRFKHRKLKEFTIELMTDEDNQPACFVVKSPTEFADTRFLVGNNFYSPEEAYIGDRGKLVIKEKEND